MPDFPLLPAVENGERLARIYRHKGLPDDNEKLGLLGAVVLQLSSTLWALAALPDGKPGDITETRARLVNGAATAGYARQYGLHEHLQCPVNVEAVRNTASAQSTLFAAYVGALFIEAKYKIDGINDWLFPLFNALTQT